MRCNNEREKKKILDKIYGNIARCTDVWIGSIRCFVDVACLIKNKKLCTAGQSFLLLKSEKQAKEQKCGDCDSRSSDKLQKRMSFHLDA